VLFAFRELVLQNKEKIAALITDEHGKVLSDAAGEVTGPVAKNISENERAGIAAKVGANPGDAIFFAAGERDESQKLLGAARLEIAKKCNLIPDHMWEFLWVVDAPMFEPTDGGGWTAVHHPFTGPKPEYSATFDKDPANALAYGVQSPGYTIKDKVGYAAARTPTVSRGAVTACDSSKIRGG
jgi:aspartyl-tRNA synthetase